MGLYISRRVDGIINDDLRSENCMVKSKQEVVFIFNVQYGKFPENVYTDLTHSKNSRFPDDLIHDSLVDILDYRD